MGDIKQFPNLRAEQQELMAHGLRTLADAIEQGIDDYDGIVVVGYYKETHEVDPMPFGLTNPETHWIGGQLINWALCDHYESFETDD